MVGWLHRAFKLVDLLFPADLALSNVSDGFRRHKIELTALQVKISIWLALFSYAFWGIWDLTRLRFAKRYRKYSF